LLGRPKIIRVSRPVRKSPSNGRKSSRCCCQTKYNAEPGRYSQRTTALPLSEWVRKSGTVGINGVGFDFSGGRVGNREDGAAIILSVADVVLSSRRRELLEVAVTTRRRERLGVELE